MKEGKDYSEEENTLFFALGNIKCLSQIIGKLENSFKKKSIKNY